MSRDELEKLAEKYQAQADAAAQNYQETGISRYSNAAYKKEHLAEALRMAAAAADEHHAYIAMKAQMCNFIWRAKMSACSESQEKRDELAQALIRDLVSYGQLTGLIGKD